MQCAHYTWIRPCCRVPVVSSDVYRRLKFLACVGAVAKEESLWRRGRAGEEAGPVRDDGSWRRDTGARSDGAWRKSKSGDEGVVTSKEEKTERQDRMGERDDRSSWRRSEQVRWACTCFRRSGCCVGDLAVLSSLYCQLRTLSMANCLLLGLWGLWQASRSHVMDDF